MSKYLIMCEGPNELEIIRILLTHNRMIFSRDDLIGLTPFHARQIDGNAQVRTELNMYPNNDVHIVRIGDVQNEKLRIPRDYKDKIICVEKYCTKPELEMLLIISEGLVEEYEKTKSSIKPKEFAKTYIKLGKERYNCSSGFYAKYYSGRVDELVYAIGEYKRIKKSHKRDELYLADLIQ